MTNLREPSIEPLVPISANRNWVMCSSERFNRFAISGRLAKIVFLFPSRKHCGGGIFMDFPVSPISSGLRSCKRVKKRPSSSGYGIGAVASWVQMPVPCEKSPASMGSSFSNFASSPSPSPASRSLASNSSSSPFVVFFFFFFFFKAERSSSPSSPSGFSSTFSS